MEKLPAGAYTCDAEGLITYYNQQAVEVWGRAPILHDASDRFCGSFKLFSADGTPIRHDQCWMALALRTGTDYVGEEIIIERPDGSRITALAHASALHDEAGKLTGAVNILVDISERKRGEQFLQAIVDTTPECVKIIDDEGRLVSMNAAGLALIGAEDLASVKGQSIYPVIAPAFREAFRALNEKVCRGESGTLEFEIVGLKGERRLMQTHAVPLPSPSDGGLMQLAITRDITDHRRAQEALVTLNAHLEKLVDERTAELETSRQHDRANLHRFKSMIANLSIGALALDEDFTILEANDIVCTMFGVAVAPAAMIGSNASVFADAFRDKIADVEEYAAQFAAMIRERKAVTDYELRLKDGRIILRDYLPVFDGETYRGQLVLFRDVTQERRIDRTKSEFMSLASHQLRTPLTIIRWGLGRLGKRLKDTMAAPEAELFRQSQDAAVRMSSTIEIMMQISRLEAGQLEEQRLQVGLRSFLEKAVGRFASLAQRKSLTLALDCPDGEMMDTDPALLEQLLDNFIGNAVKYTPEGGAVHVEGRKADDGSLHLAVRDTGCGIPKAQQPLLFKKFFRGDNVVAHDTDGTGLGLYLSSLLASLLGGTIRFVSAEGRGSTFTFILPSRASELPPASLAKRE
jgi:PAS domain S-box-containing protein